MLAHLILADRILANLILANQIPADLILADQISVNLILANPILASLILGDRILAACCVREQQDLPMVGFRVTRVTSMSSDAGTVTQRERDVPEYIATPGPSLGPCCVRTAPHR